MTDQWVPGPPPLPTPPIAPLPGANSWNSVEACSVGPNQPSITNGVVITGVPATIVAPNAWGITLNDGSGPPNFTIDHYDNAGALIDHPMEISGANGVVSINDGLVVNQVQVTPGNLVLADSTQLQMGGGAAGWFLTTDGIGNCSWAPLPAPPIAVDAPSDGNTYGRRNAAWAPALPEAPIDGAVYARQTAGWVPVSATFMPKSGGIFTGAVTFNSVVTLPANNSVVINGNAGSQRSMLIGSAGSWRWQWLFADGTAETGSNAGSNFSLNAMSDTGAILSTPLAINRASGAVTIAGTSGIGALPPVLAFNSSQTSYNIIQGQTNGSVRWQVLPGDYSAELGNNLGSNFTIRNYNDSGVQLGVPFQLNRATGNATFGYGVTVTGVLTLAAPTNLRIGGGSADQVLTTDGAGNLSWSTVTGGGAGGVGEAPEDGNLYGRTDGGWASGGTFADAVTIAQISPSLNLNKQTGTGGNQYASIYGQMLGSNRWELCLGGAVAESGTSAGSDFILYRYDNTGAYIDIPFQVTRATGVSTFSQLPSFPGGASGQALTTNGAGALSWASMPPASTTLPLPSGVAAVGVGTTYARADHVHPTTAMGDNRIINGDMRIDQRNNGAIGTASGYTIDRWQYYESVASIVQWGRNVVSAPGFPYCLLATALAAHASAAADAFEFFQPIEADMVSDFAWGTANAQPVTLSFWASASIPGTYSGSIANVAGTRSYPFSFPVTAGWTKIVIPIPGDIAGTWVMNGNAGSLNICFDLGSGANYRGPAGAWASANLTGVTGSASVVATNGASFAVTGVKLEIGSVATPYNRQSLAKSLADCQRYYQITKGDIRFLASAPNQIVDSTVTFQSMRATPTANLGGSDSALNFSTPGFYPSPNVTNSGRLEIISVTPGDTYVLGVFVVLDAEL